MITDLKVVQCLSKRSFTGLNSNQLATKKSQYEKYPQFTSSDSCTDNFNVFGELVCRERQQRDRKHLNSQVVMAFYSNKSERSTRKICLTH